MVADVDTKNSLGFLITSSAVLVYKIDKNRNGNTYTATVRRATRMHLETMLLMLQDCWHAVAGWSFYTGIAGSSHRFYLLTRNYASAIVQVRVTKGAGRLIRHSDIQVL